jgi:predicted nucleic acid-binding protein
MLYVDASALVKRYIQEPRSHQVARLLADERAATSRLSEVEIASALARRVRERAMTEAQRDRALAALDRDLGVLEIVELAPDVISEARRVLSQHPLRAGDAIQLASCLVLSGALDQPVTFVAFESACVPRLVRKVSSWQGNHDSHGPGMRCSLADT